MNFTKSSGHITHVGTGQRQHQDTGLVPTVWSADDANMIIWSLMQVLVDAAVAGVDFDPATPATYNRLALALRTLLLPRAGGTMAGPLVLQANATADLQAVPKQQLDAAIAGLGIGVDAQSILLGPKILKHGTTGLFGLDSTGNVVTFMTPFPNACDQVVVTPSTNNGAVLGTQYAFGIYGKTAAKFEINNDATATTFDWIAIGR